MVQTCTSSDDALHVFPNVGSTSLALLFHLQVPDSGEWGTGPYVCDQHSGSLCTPGFQNHSFKMLQTIRKVFSLSVTMGEIAGGQPMDLAQCPKS